MEPDIYGLLGWILALFFFVAWLYELCKTMDLDSKLLVLRDEVLRWRMAYGFAPSFNQQTIKEKFDEESA